MAKQQVSETNRVRQPAVAGLFYPRNPVELQAEVTGLLAGLPPAPSCPKALIAPHAGYVYSGPVAAQAFATLRTHARSIQRVVVIGPAHYVRLRGIAAPCVDFFETPLGPVPIDHEALAAIAGLPFVTRTDAPHAPEHALEVELPFLQIVADAFRALPLVVGDATPQQVAEALDGLWGGPEMLLVVSSDLSHYHGYEEARRRDAATAAAIERGEWTHLTGEGACGFLAVAGLLIEAGRRGLAARRLALCNSGDTAGTRDSVVGYGAWAFEAV